jgi:hypothetical protein
MSSCLVLPAVQWLRKVRPAPAGNSFVSSNGTIVRILDRVMFRFMVSIEGRHHAPGGMIVVTAFWHRSSVTGVAFRPQAIDEAANCGRTTGSAKHEARVALGGEASGVGWSSLDITARQSKA